MRISDAELEVMKVIWIKNEATSSEIIEGLKDFKWSYNTIRTMISRLEKKGAIKVLKKTGKVYTYKSMVDESKYKNEITMDLIKKLYKNSVKNFIVEYCVANKIDVKEIEDVIKEIEKK